jgi:alanine dehydrogenase
LERAALPFVVQLLTQAWDENLKAGVQVRAGKVTHAHLARDTGRAYTAL